LDAGHLVADDVVNRIVEARLKQRDCRRGFLLDGYPRTAGQAKMLQQMVEPLGQRSLVIEIKIGYNELTKRVTGRRLCSRCGAIFNVYSNPPRIPDVCDRCGVPLLARSDDRVEILEERLEAYKRQTVPVFEEFRRSGQTIHAVDGTSPANEVTQEIFRLLDRQ
jgi:adenylate kinase